MSKQQADPLAHVRGRATLSVGEAADLLGISRETGYRWAREGKLPGALRLGPAVVRVRTADLLAVLDPNERHGDSGTAHG